MADFKLALDTPAVLIHGITHRDVEHAILPAGTRYSIEGDVDSGDTKPVNGNFWILVEDDDGVGLMRYRVRARDLSGIAI